mmetsp:Transcript_18248/g.33069  ORF Transcript_18248/g.33069 Transcript_18248/m.33069 type:complete len:278 (-) Transcript_18248:160-993(-)
MTAVVVNDDLRDHAVDFYAQVDRAISNKSGTTTPVAFDCEGVNLSRLGSIELCSIVFDRLMDKVFLVDIGIGGTRRNERIAAVKRLFECDTVEKIIHDCRMDCDALFHLCGISVNNVHDTSCFHSAITGTQDPSLNDVLLSNGMAMNANRDKSVYSRNPRFWTTRPITNQMIEWASSDVDKLVELAHKQVARLGDKSISAKAQSTNYATKFKDMNVERGLVCRGSIGMFIGRGGCNLRSLQKRTGTLIYQDREKQDWFVYYDTPSSLTAVKRAMGYN